MASIILKYKNKKIKINVKKTNFITKLTGLMFRTKETDNLLFNFSSDIKIDFTSLFVFFPFLIIWLDENNKVLGSRIVKSFEPVIMARYNFRKVVEIPISLKNKKAINFFVGKKERFKYFRR
mgnify:FL=1